MTGSTKKGMSRRSFITASSAAVAALALTGCQPDTKLSTTGPEVVADTDEAAAATTGWKIDTEIAGEGKWVPASCNNNCGGGCFNKVYVQDGVVIRQATDESGVDSPESPQLRSCPRGRSHRQDSFGVDILKYPMKRANWEPHTGGKKELRGIDEWERISWDEACAIIADEVKYCAETYGDRSIMYAGVSSSYGVLAAMINRVCGGIAVGSSMSWGSSVWGGPEIGLTKFGLGEANDRLDLVNADYIVMYSCNPVWASPGTTMYYLNEAVKKGISFVFVGPEYNATASYLNAKWIRVRPGTDTAFLLAVAYQMFKNDEANPGSVIDWDFLAKYTVGINGDAMPADAKVDENFYDYVMGAYDDTPKTPEWASAISGTPVEDIKWYADMLNKKNAVTTMRSNAGWRANDSDNLLQLYYTVAWMGGHVGKPGHSTDCVYQCRLGQPAQPIFVKGKANTPAGEYVPNPITSVVNDDEQWQAVMTGKFTDIGDATNGMMRPASEQECDIHLLVFESCGDINTQLDTASAIKAIRSVNFVVATARAYTSQVQYADVALPIIGEWEQSTFQVGHQFKNREAYIFGHQISEPMFERATSTQLGRNLSVAFGFDPDVTYPESDANQAAFNQMAGSTMVHPESGEMVTLFSITAEDIAEMGVEGEPQEGFTPLKDFLANGVVRAERKPGDAYCYIGYQDYIADPEGNPRPTLSGKFEIYCQTKADTLNAIARTKDFVWKPYPSYKPPVNGYEASFVNGDINGEKGEYPYQIFNPHYLRRSHTQFDNLPWIRHAFPNPFTVSAADAKEKGVKDGDWVRIYNQYGSVLRPVSVSERLMPGVVSLPHGAWVDIDEDTGYDKAGAENMLTAPVGSGMGTAGYNTNLVNFEKWDKTLDDDYLLPARIPNLRG